GRAVSKAGVAKGHARRGHFLVPNGPGFRPLSAPRQLLTSRLRKPKPSRRRPGNCVSQTKAASGSRIQRPGEWRTLMRTPGWAGAALIVVALAVTACGTGSGRSAGGAYGYGDQTTQAATPGAPATSSSVMTAAL